MNKMQCPACGRKYANNSKFCSDDGTKLLVEAEVAGMVQPLKEPYNNPYGLWIVSTEGDVEGRTTRQLGSYEGYLDEIAQRLASEAYYSLTFRKAKELPYKDDPKEYPKSVSVTLDIGSGSWDWDRKDRAATVADLLKDRPVMVTEGQYFASVILKFKEQEQ